METFLEELENNVLFKVTKVENSILAKNTGKERSREESEKSYIFMSFIFLFISSVLSYLLSSVVPLD